ncbi:MAG: hypothetical protein IT460_14310 [Planctomycetes bacterium]|nr:hypothetical protein [Planctomycetota bacterium]
MRPVPSLPTLPVVARRVAPVLLALVVAGLAGCTTGVRGSRRPRGVPVGDVPPMASTAPAPTPVAPPPRAPEDDPDRVPGAPSVRVLWEALHGEQQQSARSAYAPKQSLPQFGPPELETILLNTSFVATPEQDRENRARKPSGRIARVPDRDMIGFLKQLESIGFFKYASPTEAVRPYFASERARGRITVDRDGESWTLVSRYGLGLAEETREIPAIYAQAKYLVQVLKNRVPTMVTRDANVDKVDPSRARKPATAPPPGK